MVLQTSGVVLMLLVLLRLMKMLLWVMQVGMVVLMLLLLLMLMLQDRIHGGCIVCVVVPRKRIMSITMAVIVDINSVDIRSSR